VRSPDTPGCLGGKPATTIVAYLYLDPALSETNPRKAPSALRADSAEPPRRSGEGDRRPPGGTRSENQNCRKPPDLVELPTALLVVGNPRPLLPLPGHSLLGVRKRGGAYLCADRVLGWIAERYGLSIPARQSP